MITVFLWGYTVFFPEDPVEIAAVVIADGIDDSVHRKRCPGQEPFRLLKFSLLQKFFEMPKCTEKFKSQEKLYNFGIRLYEWLGIEKRIRK